MGVRLSTYRSVDVGATRDLAVLALQSNLIYQGVGCTLDVPWIPSISDTKIETVLAARVGTYNSDECCFIAEKMFEENLVIKFRRGFGVIEANSHLNEQTFDGHGASPCYALFSLLAGIIRVHKTIPGFPVLSTAVFDMINNAYCNEETFDVNVVGLTRFGTGKYRVVLKHINGVCEASLGDKY